MERAERDVFSVTRPEREGWLVCSWLGRHISSASNIVFANGLLDPWSGGGVLEVCPLRTGTPRCAHHHGSAH